MCDAAKAAIALKLPTTHVSTLARHTIHIMKATMINHDAHTTLHFARMTSLLLFWGYCVNIMDYFGVCGHVLQNVSTQTLFPFFFLFLFRWCHLTIEECAFGSLLA